MKQWLQYSSSNQSCALYDGALGHGEQGNRWFLSSPWSCNLLQLYYHFGDSKEFRLNLFRTQGKFKFRLFEWDNAIARIDFRVWPLSQNFVILSAADIRAVAHVPGCRASGLEIVNQSSVQPVLTRPATELGQQAFNSQMMVPKWRISFLIIFLFIDSEYTNFLWGYIFLRMWR